MAKRKKKASPTDGSTSDQNTRPDFEASLLRLKSSLQALESDELTLEESLSQYEDGIRHLAQCHSALQSARQKIEQLVSINESGHMVTQPFDGTASEEMASGTRRSRSSKTAKGGVKRRPAKSSTSSAQSEKSSELTRGSDGDIDDSDGMF